MAPPLTLSFSSGMPSFCCAWRTTAAKASLISQTSMSSTPSPALPRTSRTAGSMPVSMMVGSTPLTAVATMRARGVRPMSAPAFSVPTRVRAAPSTMPEELPGWWRWLICSIWVYFFSATASKPPISPIWAKEGRRPPSDSTVVPGRTVSSWSRMVRPFWSTTGTTESLNRPSSHAFFARSWEVTASWSSCSRVKPSREAMRSAEMPCGTKSVENDACGSMAHAPPSDIMGTRDMDSTPPARTSSSIPERTLAAAMLMAVRPEAQKRLICTPPVRLGRPATSAAVRAMSAPWSPTGVTQPMTMSLMRSSSRPGLRRRISSTSPTSRVSGRTSWREPSFLPLPRGVRMAS